MKIAFDLDEVLGEFLRAYIKFHNKTYDTKLRYEQFNSYRLWEILDETEQDAINKVYEFHQTNFFKNIKPVPGAVEGIAELRKKHDLYVISARQDYILEDTEKWLDKHFDGAFQGVYLTNHFAKNSRPRMKFKICDKLGIDVFVEDSYKHAVECAEDNRPVILLKKRWNENAPDSPKNIIKVDSWPDIVRTINSYDAEKKIHARG